VKLIVTGSIAYDYLMTFPGHFSEQFIAEKLDRISVSFLVDTMKQHPGGCGANIAYNLALLGEKPLLVGSAGCDFEAYRKQLEKAGVDTSGVLVREDVYTASFFANTDQDGNQICSFYTGAMQFARDIRLKDHLPKGSSLTIISPDDPDAMSNAADACRELDSDFIYDPGQQVARLDGEALKKGVRGAKILILNDYEHEIFIKKTGIPDDRLPEHAEILIITLGERGAVIRTTDRKIEIPIASPDRIIDPTGVGDAFRAGLMKGMVHGLSWETSGRMGSLAAAYVLEAEGTQNHHYSLDDFIWRFIKNFGPSEEIGRLRE
jgi:adenosine kinase